jgi:hypothetical protein
VAFWKKNKNFKQFIKIFLPIQNQNNSVGGFLLFRIEIGQKLCRSVRVYVAAENDVTKKKYLKKYRIF